MNYKTAVKEVGAQYKRLESIIHNPKSSAEVIEQVRCIRRKIDGIVEDMIKELDQVK